MKWVDSIIEAMVYSASLILGIYFITTLFDDSWDQVNEGLLISIFISMIFIIHIVVRWFFKKIPEKTDWKHLPLTSDQWDNIKLPKESWNREE